MRAAKSSVESPRIEKGSLLLIAGLGDRYTDETAVGLGKLWQRFGPYIGHIRGQIKRVAYGVYYDVRQTPFSFDYIAGVEVSNFAEVPQNFRHLQIPPLKYAVFSHEEHLSKLPSKLEKIWQEWLPASGQTACGGRGDVPYYIERYGEGFSQESLSGDVEVWIPIKP